MNYSKEKIGLIFNNRTNNLEKGKLLITVSNDGHGGVLSIASLGYGINFTVSVDDAMIKALEKEHH